MLYLLPLHLYRDLTINALFYNIRTRQVEDYTGKGAQDLAAGAVRTPLPAMTTLLDDPLRVLRAIRFASRLRFSMAPELLEACMHPDVHTALGRKVSRERIGAEIDLMVRSHEPLRAFQLIHELNLAPVVFPLPSNTSPGPEAFGFSLVYLRNMHHLLEAHALKDAGVGWSTEQSKEFQQQRRIALYAAFLLPFADTKVQVS
jgi:tRNA nucleotidyltransferase (CCA-adding enzyme)